MEVTKQSCIFVKKCLLKRTNSSIFDNYVQVPKHGQQRRNNGIILKLPSVKLEICNQSFYFNGARLYNSLPHEIRLKRGLSEFRSGLTNHYLQILNFYA